MRSGKWRRVTLGLGLGLALSLVLGVFGATAARAQVHTIPRLVPAIDLNTGGPYYAPPIPGGHYTGKNLDGKVSGLFHGCLAKAGGILHGGGAGGCGPCSGCGGRGCAACNGTGDACSGLAHGGDPGCGPGRGCGLFHKGACGAGGNACGHNHGHSHGGDPGCGHATNVVSGTAQGATLPVVATAQCGDPGCGFGGKHHHRGCGLCGGRGCGGCTVADPCGACGGKGCGLCGKGGLCQLCGGAGCSACSRARGLVSHLLGHDKIKWFNGPGGPIPLTPGYTPYVNATRSPRDFLAFPPFVP